ncbi:MAG: ABC transporter permease [Chloroflexi bacterium]|nr:ABC transporter permease [Chloroflexota bacterium]
MNEIWQGLIKAVELIVSFDQEVMEIAGRSLVIAVTSLGLAALVCLPLGGLIHARQFRGKKTLVTLIQTLYSIPTVVIGLFVFLLLSRAGPLGGLNLLFTPTAMVIGQALLVAPILLGLTISALSGVDGLLPDTARSLGANGFQTSLVVLKEARFAVMAAVVLAFGRAISEVGVAIMVGGNILGYTRVMPTAISLETGKGDLALSMALGMILLFIALIINFGLNRIQQG